jgi:hypothetical protein
LAKVENVLLAQPNHVWRKEDTEQAPIYFDQPKIMTDLTDAEIQILLFASISCAALSNLLMICFH